MKSRSIVIKVEKEKGKREEIRETTFKKGKEKAIYGIRRRKQIEAIHKEAY